MFFLALTKNRLQFSAVCGNHFVLGFRCLYENRHFIVVGIYQCLASFKTCDGLNLGFGQLQNILHILGFIRLKVEDDFVFRVIDNCTTVFTVLQTKEV